MAGEPQPLNLSTGFGSLDSDMGSASGTDVDGECECEETEDGNIVHEHTCPHAHIPRERTFKDSVHGWIDFNERVCKVIDTPHFQRLRNVKQLGTSYYVWPAASHNRFEHCLGVAYLAQTQIKWLKEKQPELGITDNDVDLVTIAGLCHDLGHGPWSHVWDMHYIPAVLKNRKWRHEDASEMMFDDLRKLPTVHISDEEATVIKALIAGEASRCTNMDVKLFLFDIVANKRNGLDVDKFDYIARDNHAIGQGENVSLGKLIRSARVIKDQICYDIKDASTVYELCWSRFSLHKRIYNHKTARAIEYMVVDALIAAEPVLHIAEHITKPEEYLYLTDDIKTRIEMTKEPALQASRDIFRKIALRDLYKLVDQNVYVWDQKARCRSFFTPESVVEAAQRVCRGRADLDALAQELTAKHVIVDLSEIHYGMKDKNPLDTVRFYSKRRPTVALQAESGLISHIMPSAFGEILLRVYTRDRRFEVVIQKGYRDLLAQFRVSVDGDKIQQEVEDAQLLLEVVGSSDAHAQLPSSQLSTASTATFSSSPSSHPHNLSDTDEPTTPRPTKRTLSRVTSAKYSDSGADRAVRSTPNGNPFMKYMKSAQRPTRGGTPGSGGGRSPSPSPRKRGAPEEIEESGSGGGSGSGSGKSPPRKKGKTG